MKKVKLKRYFKYKIVFCTQYSKRPFTVGFKIACDVLYKQGKKRILILTFIRNILEFSKCISIVAGPAASSLSNSREEIFQ